MAESVLVESYFREQTLVKQHLASYNKFIEAGMQDVIDRVKFIDPNVEGYQLKLGKIRIEKPTIVEADGSRRQIMPMEARLRNLTYAAPIFLHISTLVHGVERGGETEVFIGELPVMLKSKLCHVDNMTREELVEAGEDPDRIEQEMGDVLNQETPFVEDGSQSGAHPRSRPSPKRDDTLYDM